jgi:hypothetical protein
MEQFEKGALVIERIRPNQRLIVIRRENNLYYCSDAEGKNDRELVYFAKELMSFSDRADTKFQSIDSESKSAQSA